MIGIADCNNFYVSCERVFNPSLNGRGVVILSNNDGCVISRSNEAKRIGIRMGDPLFRIKHRLEQMNLAVFSSNYTLYGDMSRRVMMLLSEFTPALTIYSIDEAFLDLSHIESGRAMHDYASRIVTTVTRGTGIPITIGVGPSKTVAKMASKFGKRYAGYHSICFIDSDAKREKALSLFPVREVWGIGRHIADKLQYMGIQTAADFAHADPAWIKKHFGTNGSMTWMELNGKDCIAANDMASKKSICTSRSFSGQGINTFEQLSEAIANFTDICTHKLRAQKSCCTSISIFANTDRFKPPVRQIFKSRQLEVATNDSLELISITTDMLKSEWPYNPGLYKKAGVLVWGIVPEDAVQYSLFDTVDRSRRRTLTETIDEINRTNGTGTIRSAALCRTGRWQTTANFLSPCYTTNLRDIIKIKVH